MAIRKRIKEEVVVTMIRSHFFAGAITASLLAAISPSAEAQPSVKQAFSLLPMQKDLEIDQPDMNRLDDYQVKPETIAGNRAWVVRTAAGTLLRRFADTNGDNKIDQWCYFRGGIEVYRDIDGDFNEKADQYRWFGTGGLRWGLDADEDGRIDDWKWISAEEVTAELLQAIRQQDSNRFAALLIHEEELVELGIANELRQQLSGQTDAARRGFTAFAKSQSGITAATKWVDFSAPRPGVLPGGGEHGEKDLIVYENVIAMVETDGGHAELPVGTLVKVENRWRLIGLPESSTAGFFYRAADRTTLPVSTNRPADAAMQKLVAELEKIDAKLSQSNGPAPPSVYAERSKVLRQLAMSVEGPERNMWLLQLIDSVVSSTQADDGGGAELKRLVAEIEKATDDKEVLGQANFSSLTANYSSSLQESGADLSAVQDQWISDLKGFVKSFPKTRPAAEAILQLAISEEFAGNDQPAIQWYSQIASDYPDSEMAAKAIGAMRRLDSIGKPLDLSGPKLGGGTIDLTQFRGNVVLVHYWATWCEPCKNDIDELKELAKQFGRQKFAVLGVNLDDSSEAAVRFEKLKQMPWPSVQSDGGLESELAKQMGIFTLPVMFLVDEQGKVVNRSITIQELESELAKRLPKTR